MTETPYSILEQAGLASGLLTQQQIDQAWNALIHSSTDSDRSLDEVTDQLLGDYLVGMGFVNRWQAEQLLHGRTKFTLGPYRIVDAIGRGGMGYVFKGEHIMLGRIEAIKVLPRNQTDAQSIAAFQREIRTQAQLDHPNLVRLSFADKEGDTYFLVTEYVPGADLRRLVRHQGLLDGRHAAVVISQVAEALAYVHERGLVHRDVKPGNLLVTPDGFTKLTDLGLARFSTEIDRDDEASSRHIVGTPDFVAPESVVRPTEVRSISDIYSLGCTLYYAVTGKVPFPGGKTSTKLRRHVEEAPMTPLRFNPALEPALVELIGDLMHKNPAHRVPTAAEVVQRLRPWTSQVDDSVLTDLGRYARAPGERSLTEAAIADTTPVDAESVPDVNGAVDEGPTTFASPPESVAINIGDAAPSNGDSRQQRRSRPARGIPAPVLMLAGALLVALAALVAVLMSQ